MINKELFAHQNFEEMVMDRVAEAPSIDIRQLAHELHISMDIVWRLLWEKQLHPYHLPGVQPMD